MLSSEALPLQRGATLTERTDRRGQCGHTQRSAEQVQEQKKENQKREGKKSDEGQDGGHAKSSELCKLCKPRLAAQRGPKAPQQ